MSGLRASTYLAKLRVSLEAAGLQRSRYTHRDFGRDVEHVLERGYSLWVRDSAFSTGRRARDLVDDTVELKVAKRLRGDAAVEDADAGFDLLEDTVSALYQADRTAGFHVRVRSTSSDALDGWMVSTILVIVQRPYHTPPPT